MTHIFINQITKIALRCVIRFTCKAQLFFFPQKYFSISAQYTCKYTSGRHKESEALLFTVMMQPLVTVFSGV